MIRELDEAQALHRNILGVPRPAHGRLRKFAELAPESVGRERPVEWRVVRGGKSYGNDK